VWVSVRLCAQTVCTVFSRTVSGPLLCIGPSFDRVSSELARARFLTTFHPFGCLTYLVIGEWTIRHLKILRDGCLQWGGGVVQHREPGETVAR
jgi:hypothetical protein